MKINPQTHLKIVYRTLLYIFIILKSETQIIANIKISAWLITLKINEIVVDINS